MGSPRITYNGKTINFSTDNAGKPVHRHVDAFIPRSIQRTLSGDVETLLSPRVDVGVRVQWQRLDTATLLTALDNWWQWAQQNGDWKLTLDSDRMVETVLGTAEAAAATTLRVMSITGITTGQNYVLLGGPNYQVITVAAIIATGVGITSALDYSFASGSLLRDQYYWNGVLMNNRQTTPITFARGGEGQTFPPKFFDFAVEFHEATTG